MNKAVLLIFFLFIANFASAFVVNHTNVNDFYSLTQEQTDRVRSLNWFMGHQSVGRHIINGLIEVDDNGIHDLDVIPDGYTDTTRADYVNSGPLFGNRNLVSFGVSKTQDFFTSLSSNSDLIDVGIMKYCYADLQGDMISTGAFSSATEAFNTYKNAVDAFKATHPGVVMVHSTMPLKTDEDSWVVEKNFYRDMILQEYGNEYVFDVADIESWYNGAYTTFIYNGQTYLKMNQAYTSDGGHPDLTEGRRNLARGLWVMMAKVAEDLSGEPPPVTGSDINFDGKTDIIDVTLITFWQGKNSGDANWNSYSRLDLDSDGDVDFNDVIISIRDIL